MKNTSTITLDLAKNVFQLRLFDERGVTLAHKRLSRSKLIAFIVKHPPTTFVMEACMSSHYWGRLAERHGHVVHLIPAQHVTPFVRGNKNDKNDCLAIYEASRRPNLRFVPIKTEQQQRILCLHRVRERLISVRTQSLNQTRSLLLEFGYCLAKGRAAFVASLRALRETVMPCELRLIIDGALQELATLTERIKSIEAQLQQYLATSAVAQLIHSIPGVGVINATAFSAAIDKGQAFKNAKDFAVWLGLTPTHAASGETKRCSGISKRGDIYLRKQLIHGARAVVNHAHKKHNALNDWITALATRRGKNKAVVATAHKLARLMWVLLQKQQAYQPQGG